MGAPASVDLLGTNHAPPNIESIVLFSKTPCVWGYTVVEHCEAPGTSCVGFRTINKPSMELLQGFNPMGSSHSRSPNISSSVGAIESGEAANNNTADESPIVAEASDASPPSQPQPRHPFLSSVHGPTCCTVAQCVSVLQNWCATVSFHL